QLGEPFLSFARPLGPAAYPVKHPGVLLYLGSSSCAFHDRAPRRRRFQFTTSTVPSARSARVWPLGCPGDEEASHDACLGTAQRRSGEPACRPVYLSGLTR